MPTVEPHSHPMPSHGHAEYAAADHAHGPSGVTDHGALTGLADDDHKQYQLNSARGVANGYAPLDGSGKVPIANVPTGSAAGTVSLGNHNHDATYVNASGDSMTGRLTLTGGPIIVGNDPAGSQYNGSIWTDQSQMAMRNSSSGGLVPVLVGTPSSGDHAATPNWTRTKYENMMLSGPHGPLSSYETIQHVAGSGLTVFSTALHHTSPVAGLSHVVVGGYTEIRNINAYSRASLSAYVYPYGRWHDGTAFSWTNSVNGPQHRHTMTKKTGTSSGDYGYESFNIEAWFVNRPGQRCSLGMMANVDNAYDGGVYANFGHMRIHVEVYPYATHGADDTPQWGVV